MTRDITIQQHPMLEIIKNNARNFNQNHDYDDDDDDNDDDDHDDHIQIIGINTVNDYLQILLKKQCINEMQF